MTFYSVVTYGQQQNRLSLKQEKMADYNNQFNILEKEIKDLKEKIDTLKNEWKETCVNYIVSGNHTVEDFDYLIENTYDNIDNLPMSDSDMSIISRDIPIPKDDPQMFNLKYVLTWYRDRLIENKNKNKKVQGQDKKQAENSSGSKPVEVPKRESDIETPVGDNDLGGDMKSIIGKKR